MLSMALDNHILTSVTANTITQSSQSIRMVVSPNSSSKTKTKGECYIEDPLMG